MNFSERTFRDANGALVVQSRLGDALGRAGYERRMYLGKDVGLKGWERAHSQGQGTGFESPDGIRYAPREVNQDYQNQGIEDDLRALYAAKPEGADLWLTTVTETHPGTLRLKEIQYRVDLVADGKYRTLYEASVAVENRRENPNISVEATPLAIQSYDSLDTSRGGKELDESPTRQPHTAGRWRQPRSRATGRETTEMRDAQEMVTDPRNDRERSVQRGDDQTRGLERSECESKGASKRSDRSRE